jgi:hypothetical protein
LSCLFKKEHLHRGRARLLPAERTTTDSPEREQEAIQQIQNHVDPCKVHSCIAPQSPHVCSVQITRLVTFEQTTSVGINTYI